MTNTIYARDGQSLEEIDALIQQSGEYDTVIFDGVFRFNNAQRRMITLGKNIVQSYLCVKAPNLTLDFTRAKFILQLKPAQSDCAFLYLYKSAAGSTVKGLNFAVKFSGEDSARTFFGVYNCSHSLTMQDCRLDMFSENQINMTGICNYGGVDTHLDTQADNFSLTNSRIKVHVQPSSYPRPCEVYGLYNYFANSIQVSDCFIEAKNKGEGAEQRATGIFNNGRFGRFTAANIKASGSHNIGKQLNHAHAFGFVDEGLYTLIGNCNIVAEWGGACVGLFIKGEFTKVTGNKILSTHTIKGTTVKINALRVIVSNNILTSTSRNARIIEAKGDVITIDGNLIDMLMSPEDCVSGVGAYLEGLYYCLFTNNQLRSLKTCGLYIKNSVVQCRDNLFQKEGYTPMFISQAQDDESLEQILNQDNIVSLAD